MSLPISMPWSAPVFARPPHAWKGVRVAIFPFAPRTEAAKRILPPEIELADGPGLITLLDYPQSAIHPFTELVVMLPVKVGRTLGNYVPYIYVTTDEALIPGREIAGFPKKLAQVVWQREGNRFRGSATRFGTTFLELEGTIDGPMPPELAKLQSEASRRPSINYKLIPGPAGEIEIEEITAVELEIVTHEAEIGRGTVRCTPCAGDPVADLVAGGDGPLFVIRSDNTIPAGTVLRRIERKE